MKSLVLQLFAMSLYGGLAALLALTACALLRRLHAPARWLCLLWGVATLRFLLPGGIPLPALHPQNERFAQTLAAVQNNGVLNLVGAPVPLAGAAAAGQREAIFWNILAGVWLAGSVVLLVRAGVGYAGLHRQLALATKTKDGCYTCAAVNAPFTFGIARPRIYMPQNLRGAARWEIILHEQTHISHGDTLTKPLAYLVACLHWWNPLAWLTFTQLERTMEAACDEVAIRRADKEQRARYCERILQFARRDTQPGSLAFGQGRVKERIRQVLGFRRPATGVLALCAAVLLLAGTACMAQPTVTAADSGSTAEEPPATEHFEVTEQSGGSETSTAAQNAEVLRFICPVDLEYVSRYMVNGHRGDDLVAAEGTPVYAAEAGVVSVAEWHDSLGNYVVIDHGNDENGQKWETKYAHMDSLTVAAGQTVARGEQIGTVGNTGASSGAHLHLELHRDGELLAPDAYISYEEKP